MFNEEQLHQLSLKAYRDNQNTMMYMVEKCYDAEMEQGRFEAQIEIAKRLKQINLSVEQIMEVTKLTREEVEQL